jgi:hypothetical protein
MRPYVSSWQNFPASVTGLARQRAALAPGVTFRPSPEKLPACPPTSGGTYPPAVDFPSHGESVGVVDLERPRAWCAVVARDSKQGGFSRAALWTVGSLLSLMFLCEDFLSKTAKQLRVARVSRRAARACWSSWARAVFWWRRALGRSRVSPKFTSKKAGFSLGFLFSSCVTSESKSCGLVKAT